MKIKAINSMLLLLWVFLPLQELSSQDYVVMTYNIKYDDRSQNINTWEFRKEGMMELLNVHGPHILGIQEALHHQVQYINEQFPRHRYIGVGRDDGKQKGEFSAILVDVNVFDVIEHGTFWLSENPDTISIGWDAAMERICTYSYLYDKRLKKKLWVFNTHFDHIGQLARLNSARLIADKIRDFNIYKEPVILMGDFNLLPESEGIAFIADQFNDCLEEASYVLPGPVGTFNGFDSRHITDRIDYIFHQGFKVKSYVHIDERLANGNHISDHLPVKVVLSLKN